MFKNYLFVCLKQVQNTQKALVEKSLGIVQKIYMVVENKFIKC